MTIRDLYEWAEQNGALDLEVVIQYRDGDGCFNGYDDLDTPDLEILYYGDKEKTVVI